MLNLELSLSAGSVSGAIVAIGVQPLDVLRTRMQADAAGKTFMSTLSTLQEITRTSGVSGLWRGTGEASLCPLILLVVVNQSSFKLSHVGSARVIDHD